MKTKDEFVEETVVEETESTGEVVEEQAETAEPHKKPWLLRHPLFAKLSTYFVVAAGGAAAGYVISKKVMERCAADASDDDELADTELDTIPDGLDDEDDD